jgi:DUF971 family protein
MRITWSDGIVTVIPVTQLRSACPCAGCRAAHEVPRQMLPVIPGGAQQRDMVEATYVELVGSYALRIRWKDGHDTGIYDFALLRRLGSTAPSSHD